jgi:hypothetical protein
MTVYIGFRPLALPSFPCSFTRLGEILPVERPGRASRLHQGRHVGGRTLSEWGARGVRSSATVVRVCGAGKERGRGRMVGQGREKTEVGRCDVKLSR